MESSQEIVTICDGRLVFGTIEWVRRGNFVEATIKPMSWMSFIYRKLRRLVSD